MVMARLLTKAYEGYCRLPMAVMGAIAATGAGVVMYVWLDAGADAMWPLMGGSVLLLAALGQTVSETLHRKQPAEIGQPMPIKAAEPRVTAASPSRGMIRARATVTE